jgi:precorrin-3B methylase
VKIVPFAEFNPDDVDMLTLVMVGSSQSKPSCAAMARPMPTPRAAMRKERSSGMTVHFIGAGPGAPDLITVRGLKIIQSCPVCLYAGSLVPEEIVKAAPKAPASSTPPP